MWVSTFVNYPFKLYVDNTKKSDRRFYGKVATFTGILTCYSWTTAACEALKLIVRQSSCL